MKKLLMLLVTVAATFAMAITVYAGSYSSAWYKSGNNWYIRDGYGNTIKNAWVCDNAAGPNCANNWYIIDTNGTMVTAPLVMDANGNYYSLETGNNNNYGMLRTVNGTYDGIPLTFNQVHNSTFGAITNPDGINALKAKYGVYNISHINPNNYYYTANYVTTDQNNTSSAHYINYYVRGSKWKTSTSYSRYMTVAGYGENLRYWQDNSTGEIYYPGDEYYFSGSRTTANLHAVLETSTVSYYTVVYLKNGSTYKTDTRTGNQFTVPSCSGYSDMSFAYWEDEYGNHWNPGEIFTAPTQYEYMNAVFTSNSGIDYWGFDGGEDIYDYLRDSYYEE